MASLSKRDKKWTATARLPDTFKGPFKSKSISSTFKSKRDAQLWIDSTESSMRLGTWTDPRLDPKPNTSKGYLDRPLRDTIKDYITKITPKKKGADQERAMLNMFIREDFSGKTVRELSSDDFVTYRDRRLDEEYSNSTIRNNLNTLSAIYRWIINENKISTPNPIATIREFQFGIPQPEGHRERRLEPGEEDRIWVQLTGGTPQNRQWAALFPLLMETGMRAGEACSIEAGWVNASKGFIRIPKTKIGVARNVALSRRAYQVLAEMAKGEPDDALVFKFTPDSRYHEWRKITEAAGCPDLRTHDLRHEALSRMSARGADTKTLMRQSGHKSVQTLIKYLNPTDDEHRAKLFGADDDSEPESAAA